jgi:hypothetical protein
VFDIEDAATAEVTLELLQDLMIRCLDEAKIPRRECSEMRSLLVSVADQGRRTARRVGEVRDDIEIW